MYLDKTILADIPPKHWEKNSQIKGMIQRIPRITERCRQARCDAVPCDLKYEDGFKSEECFGTLKTKSKHPWENLSLFVAGFAHFSAKPYSPKDKSII